MGQIFRPNFKRPFKSRRHARACPSRQASRIASKVGIIFVLFVGFGLWNTASQNQQVTADPQAVVRADAAPDVETLTGQASVIDGDTIEIHGQTIRFNGIDAPERAQLCVSGNKKKYRCGQDSAFFLANFLKVSNPTRCEFVEWDHRRFVGNCFRADGVSVAASMVRAGHALDWEKYSKGKYAGEQAEAKAERLGLWDGEFELPWLYRDAIRAQKKNPAPSAPQSLLGAPKVAAGSGCKIKGNISIDTGQKIYHVPGQKFYERTKISPEHGERWFCSEDEARSAGWRRSKR